MENVTKEYQQGPKRILALDGGGIRGALTLGFLERLETLIREKEGDEELLLCDYFDLIGGTSTGAIIAAGLSIGMTAGEIKDLYLNIGDKIFGTRNYFFLNPIKRWRAKYSFEPLDNALKEVYGDIKIGDSEIRTGLCIVAKRADTFSTWPIINNPEGKYFKYNKDMLLRQAVRASAAAPTYFEPKQIFVDDKGQKATFIDGGLSLANNPALQLFLVATLKGFRYNWPVGEDKLTLISVGTGTSRKKLDVDKVARFGLGDWAQKIPELFMEDANFLNQTILQFISNSPTARKIDSEIETLDGDLLGGKPLLCYLRYNITMEQDELNKLGLEYSLEEVKSLQKMDESKNKEELYKIGAVAASRFMNAEHLR